MFTQNLKVFLSWEKNSEHTHNFVIVT